MENAVEALKIAGAVLVFVLALSLSISSLSQANSSVSTIATIYDKEAQYQYVKPTTNLNRTVGADTVVSTMYRAYSENIKIVFQKSDKSPLPIYYKTNQSGKKVDENNIEVNDPNRAMTINVIDLSEEGFATLDSATQHLSMILAGKNKWKAQANDEGNQTMLDMLKDTQYGNQFMEINYPDGFYEYLSKHTFVESLGEYYQGGSNDNETASATKIKKRVIVCTLKD